MVIYQEKTKVMLFNPGRDYDFAPIIQTEAGVTLEVIGEARLLGIVVRTDMSGC